MTAGNLAVTAVLAPSGQTYVASSATLTGGETINRRGTVGPGPGPNPTPSPTSISTTPPPVTVVPMSVQAIKAGNGKRARKATEILAPYSGDLATGSGQDVASYILSQPGKDRKYGTGDGKRIRLVSARYAHATHTVALFPRGVS